MDAAIQVADLSVVFGRHRRRNRVEALAGVSLTVPKGHLLGILGPNGSGKTTLLRCLSGLQAPQSGSATVLGRHPADPELIPRVGFQPEEPAPWPVLTGREHLLHMAALQGIEGTNARARVAFWLDRMGLTDAQHRQVKTYSTGMTKRLTLATALLTDPEVLLLDEPTAGLDPEGSELVMELLRERAAAGGAIVIASHHLQEIENACDSVLVLVRGVARAQGTLDDLLGTDALNLVVDGLDEAGRAQVIEAIEAAGGSVESVRPKRRHLFALFRSWTSGTS